MGTPGRNPLAYNPVRLFNNSNENCQTCDSSYAKFSKLGRAESNNNASPLDRFGVCCVFTISASGSTTSENCSYIQNPSFPAIYSETSSLTYTVNKCSSDVCSIRLDFESFTTAGPSSTSETNGGECTDSLVVTVSQCFFTTFLCTV